MTAPPPVSTIPRPRPATPGGAAAPVRRPLAASRELLQFALSGVVALVVLAVAGMSAMHSMAVHEAVAQARAMTVADSRLIVAPAVTDALVAGDPKARATFDQVIRERVLLDRLVRVKLWRADGTIVYSDDSRLVGRKFALEPDDLETLRTGRPAANLSDLSLAENELERSAGRLVQVYTRLYTPGGEPVLFETYLRFDSVLSSSSNLLRHVVPAFLLALLALQVLQLPLAWRLVGRVHHGLREREALQRRALEASDVERARIARNLHDGVVQNLAAVAYSLAVSADQVRRYDEPRARQIDQAATMTREGAAELRSLISDITPPSLQADGLLASLADLLGLAEVQGLRTELVAVAEPHVSDEVRAALYRAAQEAVRNVVRHAHATTVRVELVEAPRTVTLLVDDDGLGIDDTPPPDDRPRLGITLLEGLAHEVGGRVTLTARPGGGTRFCLELPRR